MTNEFKADLVDRQRRIVAYLDGLQAKVNAPRELQSASGEELRPFFERTLMPSAEGATIGRGV